MKKRNITIKMIRHGISIANTRTSNYYNNFLLDSPNYFNSDLSEEGITQINSHNKVLVKQLGSFDLIISSPIIRAFHTACLIYNNSKILIKDEVAEAMNHMENRYNPFDIDLFNKYSLQNKVEYQYQRNDAMFESLYPWEYDKKARLLLFREMINKLPIDVKSIVIFCHYNIIKYLTGIDTTNLGIVVANYNIAKGVFSQVTSLPLVQYYNNTIIKHIALYDNGSLNCYKVLSYNLSWQAMTGKRKLGLLTPPELCQKNVAYAINFMREYDFIGLQEASNYKLVLHYCNNMSDIYNVVNVKTYVSKKKDITADIVAIYNKTKYILNKVIAAETGNINILSNDSKIIISDNSKNILINEVGGRPLLGLLVTDLGSEREVLYITLHMEHTNILLNNIKIKSTKYDFKTLIKKFDLEKIVYLKNGELMFDHLNYFIRIIQNIINKLQIKSNIDIIISGDFNYPFQNYDSLYDDKSGNYFIKLDKKKLYFLNNVKTCCDNGVIYRTNVLDPKQPKFKIWEEYTNNRYLYMESYDMIMATNKCRSLCINPAPFPASDHQAVVALIKKYDKYSD